MEKIRKNIYFSCLFLALGSLFLTLLSTVKQRDLFYFSFYFCVIGLFLERKKISFLKPNLSHAVILMGVIKLLWFFISYRYGHYDFQNDQLGIAKRLIIAGIMMFYLSSCYYHVNVSSYRHFLFFTFSAAFICSTLYGIVESFGIFTDFSMSDRIVMSTHRATVTAYIYSTISILFIYLLFENKRKYINIIIASMIAVSYFIIILTSTRAVILTYPFFIAAMGLFYFKRIHIKSVLLTIVLLVLGISLSYSNYIKPRMADIGSDISNYEVGQDHTSLGARFSMWIVGSQIFLEHPWGVTQEERKQDVEHIVNTDGKYQAALEFLDIHLHNELIETASLQGILGVLSILIFYGCFLFYSLKNRNIPILAIICCMILYGLTDVILLSAESIVFYLIALTLFLIKGKLDRRIPC